MIENPTATAPLAANARVYTVVWQGINYVNKHSGMNTDIHDDDAEEDAFSFATEVVPAQYGHLALPTDRESWGYMACGEEHDGDNPYDSIDVLFVFEGGQIAVDLTETETPE